jgi:hypothetical protein
MTGNGAAADSPAADPHAPQQDGRVSRSMLLAKGCLRVLVQSLQAKASPRFYEIGCLHNLPRHGGTRFARSLALRLDLFLGSGPSLTPFQGPTPRLAARRVISGRCGFASSSSQC